MSQANDVEAGLNSLRSGQGADLIMIDCKFDISPLVSSLKKERISVPVVACGVENDSRAAVNAIKAGAQEYVPLPPDQELISAIFESVGFTTSTTPFQSGVKSDDLQVGQTFSVVTRLHFLHAISRAILASLYFFFFCRFT